MDTPHYALRCDDGPDILGVKRVKRIPSNVRLPVIAAPDIQVPPGVLRMTRGEFYEWSRVVVDRYPERIPTAAKCITTWTDGSWVRDTGTGGYGAIIFDAMQRDMRCEVRWGSSPDDVPITNIRAEAYGILTTMRYAHDATRAMDIKFGTLLTIVTDSEFWINMLTEWVPKWSDAKRRKCRNADLVASLWGLMCQFKKDGVDVEFRFIPSHDKRNWLARGAGALRLSTALNNAVDAVAAQPADGQFRAVLDYTEPFDISVVLSRAERYTY